MSSPIYKPASQNLTSEEKVQKSDQPTGQDDADTRCGFWVYKPAGMQPCARISVFTACYSVAALMSSTLNAYVNSQVTTLERQFGFTSKQTGIILAANDIGYLVCVLFVGYLASRIHIPRSLGVATITYGVSGIACSLPHFLFGANVNFDPTAENTNITNSVSGSSKKSAVFGTLCDLFNSTHDSCDNQQDLGQKGVHSALVAPDQIATVSLVIIVIGMALQGFGKAPRFSFTVIYVDDNTAKANTGFYIGIITTLGILGPAVAFVMGGVFSRMYVTLEDTTLTPRHPKWIGAWWLGYIVFGIISLIIALPLFCFPRKLPRRQRKDTDPENVKMKGTTDNADLFRTHKSSHNGNKESSGVSSSHGGFSLAFIITHFRDFLGIMYRVLTNPVYLCMVIASCCSLFTISGSSSYTPKYLERMFHLPAHTANYIMAAQSLCTASVGTFVGGYLTKRLKMTAQTAVLFNLVVISSAFLAQLMGLAFQCEQPAIYNWPSDDNSCNKDCNCPDNSYFPVCGGDGKTYYSPCHAGCIQVEQYVYTNCTCIPGGSATGGICDYGCSHLYAYPIFVGLRVLFTTLAIIPKMIVLIRCVSEKDRSMALAFATFMTSMFGWLLGPIIFGNIIDGICKIWDITCNTRGRCLLYDNSLFRVKLHGYGGAGFGCAIIFLSCAYLYARCTKCLDTPAVVNGQVKDNKTEVCLVFNGGSDHAADQTEKNGVQDSTSRMESRK